MTDEDKGQYSDGMRSYLHGRVSRAQALKGAGVAAAAAAFPTAALADTTGSGYARRSAEQ